MEFLGHETSYWLELERKAKSLDVVDWIKEVAKLRAKVSFYEARIKQMMDMSNINFK